MEPAIEVGLDAAHHASLLEDRDAVADGDRLVQLVGDEDDGEPVRLERRRTFWSSAMPCGVSIEVGSSRMSTRDPFQSALMISICCC